MPSLREESADPGRTRRGAVATTARDRSSAVLRDGNEPPEKKQKEISEISIECTNRGSHLLEDHMSQVQFTLGHLSLEIVDVDRIKGKMICTYNVAMDDVTLKIKLSWRMKFVVVYEGKKYHGHLVITSMTREVLMEETKPFPMTIAWFNEKSPLGLEFNQVTAILLSSRCREHIRKHYVSMEKRCIQDFMPRFQTQRQQGDYRNNDGKKKAAYDLTAVTENIATDIAIKEKERSRMINDRLETAQSSTRSRSSSRAWSPLRAGRAQHDADGVAIGDIGEVHGVLPKELMLKDFFTDGGTGNAGFGIPAMGSRGGEAGSRTGSAMNSRGK